MQGIPFRSAVLNPFRRAHRERISSTAHAHVLRIGVPNVPGIRRVQEVPYFSCQHHLAVLRPLAAPCTPLRPFESSSSTVQLLAQSKRARILIGAMGMNGSKRRKRGPHASAYSSSETLEPLSVPRHSLGHASAHVRVLGASCAPLPHARRSAEMNCSRYGSDGEAEHGAPHFCL